MPASNAEQSLMPSMLDRLIDPESGGTEWRRGYGVRQTIEAVRRDLEDLLNTRQPMIPVADDFPHVTDSMVNYGLPDFASMDTSTSFEREKISRRIETIIARYEPRLRDVRAVMIDPGDEKDRNVKFHIDGRLKVEPAPEVGFETVLELTTGHAEVRQRAR